MSGIIIVLLGAAGLEEQIRLVKFWQDQDQLFVNESSISIQTITEQAQLLLHLILECTAKLHNGFLAAALYSNSSQP